MGESASAASEFSEQAIFVSGTGGYSGYRIPAILTTGSGALLTFCEGRKNGFGDHGDIDIVLRRSTDNGLTWSPLQLVVEEGGSLPIAFGNPAPVLDQSTGHIHLLCCRDNDRVFHLVSTDDGVTWSSPMEITAAVKRADWGWYATGPVHGIQLKRGPHAGRLVIPCDHRSLEGAFGAHAVYSDDHGLTWQIGAVGGTVNGFTPNETSCVELTSGASASGSAIYFNTRNESGTWPGNRGIALSLDSGMTFEAPGFRGISTFSTPVVQGALLRFAETDEGSARNKILFSCPNSSTRSRMSVWSSTDETANWTPPQLVFDGPSAYSDMARTADGRVALFYEKGNSFAYETIALAIFNEAWLNEGGATIDAPRPAFWALDGTFPGGTCSVLPDAIRDSHQADNNLHLTAQTGLTAIEGSPGFGNGRALRFAGNGGLSISDAKSRNSFDFAAGESFTVETVFRQAAGSTQVGALVAKDFLPLSPSWWLRSDTGKVRFLVSDTAVERFVTSSVQINDGQWHHVAAVRDATDPADKKLRIYVDGQLSGTVADTTTGPLANGQHLWIGRYNNGNRLFTGDIDFVRITPGALEPEEFVTKWTQYDADGDRIPDDFERQEDGTLNRMGTGDTDGDGIDDLLEYAIGTNPLIQDLPSVSFEAGPDSTGVHVRERELSPWLNLQLWSSGDLSHWTEVSAPQTRSPRPDGLFDRTDHVIIPSGAGTCRFFRYGIKVLP